MTKPVYRKDYAALVKRGCIVINLWEDPVVPRRAFFGNEVGIGYLKNVPLIFTTPSGMNNILLYRMPKAINYTNIVGLMVRSLGELDYLINTRDCYYNEHVIGYDISYDNSGEFLALTTRNRGSYSTVNNGHFDVPNASHLINPY